MQDQECIGGMACPSSSLAYKGSYSDQLLCAAQITCLWWLLDPATGLHERLHTLGSASTVCSQIATAHKGTAQKVERPAAFAASSWVQMTELLPASR